MEQRPIQRIKTISEFHRLRGFPPPEHPLISIVDYSKIVHAEDIGETSWMLDFYQISMKRGMMTKFRYGQQDYDFNEGVMFFMAPQQVFRIEAAKNPNSERSGWMLMIHPDFLWNTPLANMIGRYAFFDYSVNEALFLSEKEKETLNAIIRTIEQEYHSVIDTFSKQIIVSQIETLLHYSERFYHRQFITREKSSHEILGRLDARLSAYFNSDDLISKGLPSVKSVAEELNVSPKYLSGLLKVLTGQSTQQHIHDKLIEKAKEKLSTTSLSVSEIAYQLGFEHSQSFSKLFKSKTKQSPVEFRQGFN